MKALLCVILGCFVAPVFAPVWCQAAAVEALPKDAAIPPLSFKTGQIVALSEMRADPSTFLFEAATGSRYGHVGVIVQTPDGPLVYHANPPAVQTTPLAQFLERARTDDPSVLQFTLLEPVEPLSDKESRDLEAVMNEMVAKRVPYNFSMVLNPDSVNCSEFCHKVFKAIGRAGLGEVERLDHSNLQAFNGALARLWGSLPPGDSPAVSPFAVVSSPLLKVLHAGLPVDRVLSDAEIFQAWKAGGGLRRFSSLAGIPMLQLEAIGARAARTPYRPYPPNWRQPKSAQ